MANYILTPDHRAWTLKIQKGHIGIVEKVQETSSDTGVHNRAITVLHEQ